MSRVCIACQRLQQNAPEVFRTRQITQEACDALKDNSGFNRALVPLQENCEALQDIVDCFIGDKHDELPGVELCDLREWLAEMMEGLHAVATAMVCDSCGIWLEIGRIWEEIRRIWEEIARIHQRIDCVVGELRIIWNELRLVWSEIANIWGEFRQVWMAIQNLHDLVMSLLGGATTFLTSGQDYTITYHNGWHGTGERGGVSNLGISIYATLTEATTQIHISDGVTNVATLRNTTGAHLIRNGAPTEPVNRCYSITWIGRMSHIANSSYIISSNHGGPWRVTPTGSRMSWTGRLGSQVPWDRQLGVSIATHHNSYASGFGHSWGAFVLGGEGDPTSDLEIANAEQGLNYMYVHAGGGSGPQFGDAINRANQNQQINQGRANNVHGNINC